jgi:hypothetical protein
MFLSFGRNAHATINRDLTYRYTQIWNGLVRFLRVDNGFQVVEKNKTAGYIMFEYREKGKTFPSSFELIPVVRDGRYYIRVGLRIADMPTYIEVVLFDKLIVKLKKDFGLPPTPKLADAKTAGPQDSAAGSGGDAPKTGIGSKPPEDEEDIEVDEDKLEETEEEQ